MIVIVIVVIGVSIYIERMHARTSNLFFLSSSSSSTSEACIDTQGKYLFYISDLTLFFVLLEFYSLNAVSIPYLSYKERFFAASSLTCPMPIMTSFTLFSNASIIFSAILGATPPATAAYMGFENWNSIAKLTSVLS